MEDGAAAVQYPFPRNVSAMAGHHTILLPITSPFKGRTGQPPNLCVDDVHSETQGLILQGVFTLLRNE